MDTIRTSSVLFVPVAWNSFRFVGSAIVTSVLLVFQAISSALQLCANLADNSYLFASTAQISMSAGVACLAIYMTPPRPPVGVAPITSRAASIAPLLPFQLGRSQSIVQFATRATL